MSEPGDPASEAQRFAAERLLVLDAFLAAIDRREDVMRIAASAASTSEAHTQIRSNFGVNDDQATAILDLQIRRFTLDKRQQIQDERDEIHRTIRNTQP